MGDTPGGSAAILGFGELINRFQQTEKQNELWTAQMDDLKAKMKAEEARMAFVAQLPPEEQVAELLGKDSPYVRQLQLQKMLKTLGMGGGGSQQAPPPAPEPFGGGTPNFPLDPTLTAPPPQSVPQQMAQSQFNIESIDTNTGNVKIGPMKYSRSVPVVMPDGNPGSAPMREDGLIDMTKAVHSAVKADVRPGVGPGMASTQTPVNPYTQAPMGPTVQTGAPPTMQLETPTAGGGKVKSVVPLFPGVSGSKVTGTTAGGVRTELDLLDVPIPASEINKWTDGKGNIPPVGWTPRQAQGRGFLVSQDPMSSEAGGKTIMLSQGVEDMKKAISMILPPGGGFNRKLALGAATNSPEFAVEGSQIVRSSVLNAMSAKLRMETGAQSNESEIQGIVDRYWPSGVRDNEKSARYKMTRLLRFMESGKFALDPKGKILTIDPAEDKKKPDLGLGKKIDPVAMTNEQLLRELEKK